VLEELSRSAQDYVKALYLAGEVSTDDRRPLVSTTALAERLGVSAASATHMLKRLAQLELVKHAPYHGARLTEEGRAVALELVRHHRLLETYLSKELGVPWEEVHAEAEILEHVLSESLEERISASLGHPRRDPHGHPIPGRDGTMPHASRRLLWEVLVGESVRIEQVSDALPEGLRYLRGIGIVPGAAVEVVARGPINGPLHVRVGAGEGAVHALSRDIAEAVWVA
jgi:DtxR family Mn-dependent transcriptional regulator